MPSAIIIREAYENVINELKNLAFKTLQHYSK